MAKPALVLLTLVTLLLAGSLAPPQARMGGSCSGTGDGSCLFECEEGTAVTVEATGLEAVSGACGPLVAACVSTSTCTATSLPRTPTVLQGVCKATGVGTFRCAGE